MIVPQIQESTATVIQDPLSNLSIDELQRQLTRLFGHYKEEMGPLLYWLREKLKAPGKKGQGFGVWVKENLEISRDTADRWADDYAMGHGLKPLGKMPKDESRRESTDQDRRPHPVQFQLLLDDKQEAIFLEAWEKRIASVGEDKASQLVFKAIVNPPFEAEEAGGTDRKRPARSISSKQRRRLVH